MQHVFIVGAKSLGTYGGYETFVDKLTEYHQNNENLKYHIACKKNGDGHMDETILHGVKKLDDNEFEYHNAHCFKIKVPNIGAAQAIYYDLAALNYCIKYIKKNNIEHPVVYVLACRIGPFFGHYHRMIKKMNGKLYINPDGHEFMRAKWSAPVRRYWKLSEQLMVKHSDLVICDSINIEKYINENYAKYHVPTTYIAYGAEIRPSILKDDDPKVVEWFQKWNVEPNEYYMCCGRFVPENSFEIMIREFMKCNSKKDFVIITTKNDKLLNELDQKLEFKEDKRIKFVGTVYDQELLKKIRENAYGYFHGHTVGGTNPSLLEAMGSTKLNLLIDVGFNREVGEDAALYWSKEEGSLAELIDKTDSMSDDEIKVFGDRAKKRIREAYSWEKIAGQYEEVLDKKSTEHIPFQNFVLNR